MTNTHDRLVEAIAAWRVGVPDARQELIDAAVSALVGGSESTAVAELAGLDSDNSFVIDALIERVVSDVGLQRSLRVDPAVLATKKLARDVCDGHLAERDFTQWVHERFHHEADADILNRLAELDDDFDSASGEREIEWVRICVREAAIELLRAGVS